MKTEKRNPHQLHQQIQSSNARFAFKQQKKSRGCAFCYNTYSYPGSNWCRSIFSPRRPFGGSNVRPLNFASLRRENNFKKSDVPFSDGGFLGRKGATPLPPYVPHQCYAVDFRRKFHCWVFSKAIPWLRIIFKIKTEAYLSAESELQQMTVPPPMFERKESENAVRFKN